MLIVPLSLAPAAPEAGLCARRSEPVTVGLPLPRGVCHDVTPVSVRRSGGDCVAVQSRPLDRWSDGSIRWILLDFQADAPEGRAEYEATIDAPVPAAAAGIQVRSGPERVVVDTGAARYQFATGESFPFAGVDVAGRSVLEGARSGLTVTGDAAPQRVRADRVWIEERGPLRTVVALAAKAKVSSRRHVDLTARIELFAGSPVARCAITVRNPARAQHAGGFWELGDEGSLHLRDLALTFTLASSDAPGEVRLSPEPGAPMTVADAPVEVYQDSSGGENWQSPNHRDRDGIVRQTIRGYRVRSRTGERYGYRATPCVSIASNAGCVAATMQHFWQNFPKAFEAAHDSITLRLFPSQAAGRHEIQGGEQKTHRFAVAFAPDGVTELPLEWCRAPLIAIAAPPWYAWTGALGHYLPRAGAGDPRQRELIAAAVDGPDTFLAKRERIDEYGWRHFGDLYADHEAVGHTSGPPLVSHYNNQYDAIAGFGLQCMRTGDRRWYELMRDLAAHVVDIDIYHCDHDKAAYNGGLFWHTAHYVDAGRSTHRTYPRVPGVSGGGPSCEHNYTAGLTLHYLMTGDLQLRDAVLGLAQWVINMDDGQRTPFRWMARDRTGLASQSGSARYHGPGRGAANSLNALLDGFRLSGRAEFLVKADELVRRCIHPDDDVAARDLLDVERRWFYTVFLQALGRYLDEKAERAAFDDMYAYARGSLLQYARWMTLHERPYLSNPAILEFPTETWAAQDIRKSDVFAVAAVHADDAERARFIERSAYFFRYALDTLLTMPTRTLTRPVVLLLTNGWRYPYLRSTALRRGTGTATRGAVAPARELPRAVVARPPQFVPQKVTAMRRAQAGAGVAAALALLATWGAWLWWL